MMTNNVASSINSEKAELIEQFLFHVLKCLSIPLCLLRVVEKSS